MLFFLRNPGLWRGSMPHPRRSRSKPDLLAFLQNRHIGLIMQVNSMKHIETGSFLVASEALSFPDAFHLVSWNVNRGQHLNSTIEFLADARADVILLQETDVNARRTNCRN